MKAKFGSIIVIFVIIAILHFSAIAFGFYETEIVWIDNAQHVLAGIALGMLFLLINRNSKKRNVVFWIIGFVLITAILWELLEFLLLAFLPLYAKKFSLYSPNIIESLEDIFSNLIGGIIFAILYLKNLIK